jgi:pimeloyl-ACP methyl ester carboxylesterase
MLTTRQPVGRARRPRGLRQRYLWIVGIIVGLLLVVVVAAFAYDRYQTARLAESYPAPGAFVPVGERRMHYLCLGEGEPTLVLQGGHGGGAIDWLPVMERLADRYRVCAFDRLGQDWSDAPPQPRAFHDNVVELHTALTELGIERPVVVGHSLGGAVVQVYAAEYDAAGVVLMDGLTLDVAQEVVTRLGSYQSLNPLAQVGLLRPLGGMLAHPDYAPDLRAQMAAVRSTAPALVAMANDGAIAAASLVPALSAATGAWDDTPLLIIAAGQNGLPEEANFLQSLKNLAATHPQTTYAEIAGAHHYLMAQHPEEVAGLMQTWLASLD